MKFKFEVAGADNVCVLPKEIMDHFRLEDGELVDADFWRGGRVVLHVSRVTDTVESLVGLLDDRPRGGNARVDIIEEMNVTIANAWAGQR